MSTITTHCSCKRLKSFAIHVQPTKILVWFNISFNIPTSYYGGNQNLLRIEDKHSCCNGGSIHETYVIHMRRRNVQWQTPEWIPLHSEGMGREGGARPRGWVWTLVFQILLIAQRIETMQLKIVCINYDENSHYPFYFERVSLIVHLTGSDEGPPNCLAVVHCSFVECAQDHLLSSQPMLSGISLWTRHQRWGPLHPRLQIQVMPHLLLAAHAHII
jgi:hypothetical protein